METKSDSLKVIIFNVGHGDHILLKFPNGSYGIIDFFFQLNLNLSEPPVLTYFKHLLAKDPDEEIRIAFICFSHADIDHLHGSGEFLKWVEDNDRVVVEDLWFFGGADFDQIIGIFQSVIEKRIGLLTEADDIASSLSSFIEYKNRLKEINEFRIKWRRKYNKKEKYLNNILKDFVINDQFQVHNLAPLGSHISDHTNSNISRFYSLLLDKLQNPESYNAALRSSTNRNNISSTLLMNFREFNLLFCGDTSKVVFEECINEIDKIDINLKSQFIKVSHHGSIHSSSKKIWRKVLADEFVNLVISAGKRESLPHQDTIKEVLEIKNTDINIFRTNRCSNCLESHIKKNNLLIYDMSWFDAMYDRNQLKDGVKDALVHEVDGTCRLKNGKLLAYIFDFSTLRDNVKVGIGLSDHLFGSHGCVYSKDIKDKRSYCHN